MRKAEQDSDKVGGEMGEEKLYCGILATTGKETFDGKRCDEQDVSMVKMTYTFKFLSLGTERRTLLSSGLTRLQVWGLGLRV